MIERVRKLQAWISRRLGIPAGLALLIAIILVPKLIGAGILVYSTVVWVKLLIQRRKEK